MRWASSRSRYEHKTFHPNSVCCLDIPPCSPPGRLWERGSSAAAHLGFRPAEQRDRHSAMTNLAVSDVAIAQRVRERGHRRSQVATCEGDSSNLPPRLALRYRGIGALRQPLGRPLRPWVPASGAVR